MTRLVPAVILFPVLTLSNLSGGVIQFNNGDRMTAKISGLSEGKLKVSTSYAGEITLDFSQIENLLVDKPLVLEFQSGLKTEAIISISGDSLEIKGDSPFSVSRETLVSMELPEQPLGKLGLLDNWHGEVDLGIHLSKGNTDLATSILRFSPERSTENDHITGFFQSHRTVENGDAKAGFHRGSLRYDRFMSERLFAFVLGEAMRDAKEELALRTREAVGVGFQWTPGPDTDFSFLGGLTLFQERYQGLDYELGKEGLLTFEMETTFFGSLAFDQRVQLTRRVSENRYLTQFDAGIRMPFFNSLTFGFRFFDKYDSRPTSATEKNDIGFLSTVGYTF